MSRESGDRATFLARVRRRLAAGAAPRSRPLPETPDPPTAVRWRTPLGDPVAAFRAALEAVGGRVREVAPGPAGIDALLAEVLETERATTAVLSRDPECGGLAERLTRRGVRVQPFGSAADAAGADLGVTGAAFGIARTGSLVVDAGRAGGRSASLLPPAHLALLRRDRLLETPGDLLRRLDAHFPDGPPSNLVLITGPSRSADIELRITLGVHGPGSLWAGLL